MTTVKPGQTVKVGQMRIIWSGVKVYLNQFMKDASVTIKVPATAKGGVTLYLSPNTHSGFALRQSVTVSFDCEDTSKLLLMAEQPDTDIEYVISGTVPPISAYTDSLEEVGKAITEPIIDKVAGDWVIDKKKEEAKPLEPCKTCGFLWTHTKECKRKRRECPPPPEPAPETLSWKVTHL